MRKITLFAVALVVLMLFSGCSSDKEYIDEKPLEISGLTFEERVKNDFAECFSIDRYSDGYSIIRVMDGNRFLTVPEGKIVPDNLPEDITIIKKPLSNAYLAASSAMSLFSEIDSGEAIRFSGTKTDDWYIQYAKDAMTSGDMVYAGKYKEPDYELLVNQKCSLAIESSMIGHSPEVKEKLIELGIPVFIDYSSYEPHPLGRSEWIKVYAEMCGKSELASELFNKQAEILEKITDKGESGKTAVFFYINSSGQAVTRKSGDYITKMIELAGGKNIFGDLGNGNNSSTVIMEMEKFYASAKDADFIIYNSTIGGEIKSIDELLSKNKLLADFKAVKEGNVWCLRENLYQESMKLGTVISDLNSIFNSDTDNNQPQFLFKLESSDNGE